MSAALPFDLPSVSRAHCALGPGARAAGIAAAERVAAGLGAFLRAPVRIEGRALPGPARPLAGAVRLGLDLPALPGQAVLELEAAFVSRVVDRFAGGDGTLPPALALTPVETSALELLALVALEALGPDSLPERLLAPRLSREAGTPEGPLVVALTLEAGPEHGRGRLLLPPAAVRALSAAVELSAPAARLALDGRLCRATAPLTAEELEALAPGDVVLAEPEAAAVLAFPGGLELRGRLEEQAFHVEELAVNERTAAFPITLAVELGRVPVTLGELARLEPGATLELPLGRRGLVTLRAGERAVARGELCEVDGALGVRVLSLGDGELP
ncbi:FliM/FliN family flagellar motor switch protein [Anaeromyxobacter paludicola]|uniref:Flagellar motor switch protein FliM n=1 Tax=Anaeromyxobacter paludicola TaxID=2918171 RepID=A0ABM7XAR6_9BACT|nr:FliM/FliN family flagellar motor switch protein [Anaeromyxobacter paludicola]BDG08944.1 hypothetical protein AMPC_20570 [Anaeromyxobacter paludicola]